MRPTFTWRLLIAGLLVAASSANAQWAGPTAPRLPVVSSDVERGLAQVDALLAAEAWDEAVDAMLRLLDEADTTQLVALTPQHQVTLAEACGGRIARWPAAGLAAYRARVDATARAELEAAIAARSTRRLARVATEYFATSHGDEALWALGTLELEQGNYGAARRAWMRLSSQLHTPDGRPWGIALVGADLSDPAVWHRVEEAMSRSASDNSGGVYPDADIESAEVMARLAVVSIRERNFSRAEVEIALLKRLYPDAEGILAGRKTRLVEGLELALASAAAWPVPKPGPEWRTFAGSYDRSKVAEPIGDLRGVVWSVDSNADQEEPLPVDRRRAMLTPRAVIGSLASPAEVVGDEDRLVFLNGSRLTALALGSGKPLFGEAGEVFLEESLWPPAGLENTRVQLRNDPEAQLLLRQQLQFQIQGRIVFGRSGLNATAAPGTRSRMVTLEGDILFATVAPGGNALARGGRGATRHLMAFDLEREGKLVLDIPPAGSEWQFSGPPVVTGEVVYAAMREGEGGQRVHIASFSRTTGRMLWRRLVVSVGTSEFTYHEDLLTLAGDTLYFNTNAGAIVAVSAVDGRTLWAHLYQQWNPRDDQRLERPQRPPGPALHAQGIVVCLPTDATGMFALDAATGRPLWFDAQTDDVTELLAAFDGTLVSSGKRLMLTNLLTGQRRYAWPDSPAAGITGSGRGAVAGGEVFWPTNRGLYVFELATGRQSRRTLPLEDFAKDGVAVVPVPPYLVVSSHDRVTVFGPEGSPPPPPAENSGPPAVSATSAPLQGLAIDP